MGGMYIFVCTSGLHFRSTTTLLLTFRATARKRSPDMAARDERWHVTRPSSRSYVRPGTATTTTAEARARSSRPCTGAVTRGSRARQYDGPADGGRREHVYERDATHTGGLLTDRRRARSTTGTVAPGLPTSAVRAPVFSCSLAYGFVRLSRARCRRVKAKRRTGQSFFWRRLPNIIFLGTLKKKKMHFIIGARNFTCVCIFFPVNFTACLVSAQIRFTNVA